MGKCPISILYLGTCFLLNGYYLRISGEVVDLHSITDGITTTISRTISGFSVEVREIHFQGFSFVNQ